MADLDSQNIADVMTEKIDGVYGTFKTTDSFSLNYILASLKISDIERLSTASESIDISMVTFEELIQRDIDYDRVENELIANYLEQGKDRVLFFPPLLASVMCFENGMILDKYSEVKAEISESKKNKYYKTWDKDKFSIELNLTDKSTGFELEYEGNNYNYINYASTLAYNPSKVKLIVIDGQHRFVALKELYRTNKAILKDVQVPVCIFFTPEAIESSGTEEKVKNDMRDLFVTINETAKVVSGHFITLLNDRSLSALCVRDFADFWKTQGDDPSKLHMIEWNTRENKTSYTRMKKYSITTVSIVGDCLSEYILSKGMAELLMCLSEVQTDLEQNDNWPKYSNIGEDTFALGQVKFLKSQIKAHITPSLDALFSLPLPYQQLWTNFQSVIENLNLKVANGTTGIKQYKEEYLYKFRKVRDKKDQQKVVDAASDFEKQFQVTEDDYIYLTNVFQQGLIRAWAIVCQKLIPSFGLPPEHIAISLVAGLSDICFNSKVGYFLWSRSYMQGLVYVGQKIMLNQNAKNQWHNLILCTLLTSNASKSFVDKVKENSSINSELLEKAINDLAVKSLSDYFESLTDKIRNDINKNWKIMDIDESVLQFLLIREKAIDEKKQDEFCEKIDHLVKERVDKAKDIFSNIIGVKTADLF
jgi:uncharacterized membrane protein YfbV (UPF0208 family)